MTHKDVIVRYNNFKQKYYGKYIDYDGEYGGQCWDLAEQYFTEALELPASILAGCGLVSNMLYPPKLDELLEYFVEVPLTQMDPGDVVIWEYGHIAIFDSWDGTQCWYFSQNPNPCEVITINAGGQHAFRLKTEDPGDYKVLYEQELEKNKILEEKINNAIKDLS